jgi:Na+(H+)/acetate symporter ActP
MAVTGAIYFIGATALLVCGIYWQRASRAGAYLALTSGLLAVLGLDPIKNAVGLDRLETLLGFNLSEAHIGLFAVVTAIVLMVTGSILLPDRCPSVVPKQESTT